MNIVVNLNKVEREKIKFISKNPLLIFLIETFFVQQVLLLMQELTRLKPEYGGISTIYPRY